ncbi:uncharacterized protein LOC106640728 [Copidosoma floridanum]|uniref:uncharacterized protein LOC106640728 n=1 Tax=Copidosoma floridanum TaxID=29053 RepID=UPI0006C9C6EB|nr:uncharacterized protein LOC106640728 [Copidosoma floridanum]
MPRLYSPEEEWPKSEKTDVESSAMEPFYKRQSTYFALINSLSETFLKPDKPSTLVNIQDYSFFRCDRLPATKGGGGAALYVHNSLRSKLVSCLVQGEAYSKKPEFLLVEIQTALEKFLCATVYNPPKAGFWSEVEEAIMNCNSSFDHLILMGDLNLDWHVKSTSVTIFKESLQVLGLHPVSYGPTHHTENSSSTIDYICLSEQVDIESFFQFEVFSISKHDAIFVKLKHVVPSADASVITRRNFKSFNRDEFREDLIAALKNINPDGFPEHKVAALTTALSSLYDKHAPYETVTRKRRPLPWITPHLKCKCTSQQWKVINDLGLTKKSDTPKVNIPFDLDVANRHFVGKTSVNPLFDVRRGIFLRIDPDQRFYFRHVTFDDVRTAILSARSNAMGSDGIPLCYFNSHVDLLATTLMSIFDASFQSSTFPEAWKIALVRPMPKKSGAKDLKDFRPISIQPALSKIFEFIAYKQLMEYINSRDLLCTNQSGFRAGHSTQSALTKIVDDIREFSDNHEITLLVSIDMSRAFDAVNINLLCEKLVSFGLSDSACNWIRSYLTGRSQIVIDSEGRASKPSLRVSGVPQGSILGPLLFSLFINDLPDVCDCSYHLYADDFCFYVHGPLSQAHEVVDKANRILDNIWVWSDTNGLYTNPEKSRAVWLGTRGTQAKLSNLAIPDIKLKNSVIVPSDTMKLLGVTLDSNLTFRPHTIEVAKRCFSALARLRRNAYFLPVKTKLMLVKSLVFSILEYCPALQLGLSSELKTKLKIPSTKNAEHRVAEMSGKTTFPLYPTLHWIFLRIINFLRMCFPPSPSSPVARAASPQNGPLNSENQGEDPASAAEDPSVPGPPIEEPFPVADPPPAPTFVATSACGPGAAELGWVLRGADQQVRHVKITFLGVPDNAWSCLNCQVGVPDGWTFHVGEILRWWALMGMLTGCWSYRLPYMGNRVLILRGFVFNTL